MLHYDLFAISRVLPYRFRRLLDPICRRIYSNSHRLTPVPSTGATGQTQTDTDKGRERHSRKSVNCHYVLMHDANNQPTAIKMRTLRAMVDLRKRGKKKQKCQSGSGPCSVLFIMQLQGNLKSSLKKELLLRGELADEVCQHRLWKADEFVTVNTVVMLQTFV